MDNEIPKPIDPGDDKSRAAFRRLLLSKRLFMHGVGHSSNLGTLDKMIAVHNFHNAIEIVLKAIILHYDIPTDNQRDLGFNDMIKTINKHDAFRGRKLIIPYQRQIVNLNDYRNLVQHHGAEPEASSTDAYRIYCRDFMAQVCQDYFDISYDDLSSVDLIVDSTLKGLMRLSMVCLREKKFGKSSIISQIGFEWARTAILDFLPNEKVVTLFYAGSDLTDSLMKLEEKADANLYLAAMLSSGISLVEYERFLTHTPSVDFAMGGTPYVRLHTTPSTHDDALWVHDFVVNSIIHWQIVGLQPCVSDRTKKTTQEIIDNGGVQFDPTPGATS